MSSTPIYTFCDHAFSISEVRISKCIHHRGHSLQISKIICPGRKKWVNHAKELPTQALQVVECIDFGALHSSISPIVQWGQAPTVRRTLHKTGAHGKENWVTKPMQINTIQIHIIFLLYWYYKKIVALPLVPFFIQTCLKRKQLSATVCLMCLAAAQLGIRAWWTVTPLIAFFSLIAFQNDFHTGMSHMRTEHFLHKEKQHNCLKMATESATAHDATLQSLKASWKSKSLQPGIVSMIYAGRLEDHLLAIHVAMPQ